MVVAPLSGAVVAAAFFLLGRAGLRGPISFKCRAYSFQSQRERKKWGEAHQEMRGALCKKSEKAGGVWAMGCAEDDDSRSRRPEEEDQDH